MNTSGADSRFAAYLGEWFPEDDDAYFDYKLRILGEWDEAHFRRMIATAVELLAGGDTTNPGMDWDGAFHRTIERIISLMTHPGFLAHNAFGLAPEEYRRFMDERVRALRSVQQTYDALDRR